MRNPFTPTFAIGLGVIAIAVVGVLYMQRGARIGLAGAILKVRTAPLDENSSIAVVDFRFANPGNVPFWVRTVSLVMEDKDGSQYEGKIISEGDAKRLFESCRCWGRSTTKRWFCGTRFRGTRPRTEWWPRGSRRRKRGSIRASASSCGLRKSMGRFRSFRKSSPVNPSRGAGNPAAILPASRPSGRLEAPERLPHVAA